MDEHYYAMIMAGGGGTRLWPLSRRDRPKQVLPLVDERTMFQIAVERLDTVFPPERILVVTGRDQVDELQAQAPQIPTENFILEPMGRDSGPAAGLGTLHAAHRDPDAVVAMLPSDHYIADVDKFRRALVAAGNLAAKGHIVTLGISPSFPATGFGYIERGELLGEEDGFQYYRSLRFTEKPDLEKATGFLMSGRFSWNSGMMFWRAERALDEFRRQRPKMGEAFDALANLIGKPGYWPLLEELWPKMPRLSVDFAIMEGARDVVVIPVDIGWSDVGSWQALYELLAQEQDENGNITRGNMPRYVQEDTTGTLVMSDRFVVTIGVRDLVIVDTDDVLMVCHRDRAQDVRTIIERLRQMGQVEYL